MKGPGKFSGKVKGVEERERKRKRGKVEGNEDRENDINIHIPALFQNAALESGLLV